jgi:hypothetical protein
MTAEDVEWTTVTTGQTFRGHEGFREFMQGWQMRSLMQKPKTPLRTLARSSG